MDILQKKHEFVVHTELLLQATERCVPGMGFVASREWTMWLELSDAALLERLDALDGEGLRLEPISEEEEWGRYLEARVLIEGALGLSDVGLIEAFVDDARRKAQRYDGRWYLALVEGRVVGAIGMVPFDGEGGRIGRLQDVDILPSEQGQGFGNRLLLALVRLAREEGMEALCLMAKADDWPRLWYERFGFVKVGESRAQPRLLSMLRKSLEEAIRTRPDCETLILYGSWARGQADLESDVDFLMICAQGEASRLTGEFDGLLLDGWVYPRAELPKNEQLLHLRDGIVFFERAGEGGQLLSELRALWKEPPKTPALWEVESQANWLRKMLPRCLRDSVEAHFRRHWLLMESLEMWFGFRGLRYPGSKEAFQFMELEHPVCFVLFREALRPGADAHCVTALMEHLLEEAERCILSLS